MSMSLTPLPDDEIDRLYRLEALAKEYKAAYLWQGGTDEEWHERLEAAKEALFEELDR